MQKKWKQLSKGQPEEGAPVHVTKPEQCGVTMARNVIWPQKWGSGWSRLVSVSPVSWPRGMLLSPSNGWIQNTRSMTATDIYLLQTRSKSEVVWPHYKNILTQNACKVSLSVFLSGWFSEKCAYSMNTGLLSLKCWHRTVKVRICVCHVSHVKLCNLLVKQTPVSAVLLLSVLTDLQCVLYSTDLQYPQMQDY